MEALECSSGCSRSERVENMCQAYNLDSSIIDMQSPFFPACIHRLRPGLRIVHFVRDLSKLVISSYLYHTQENQDTWYTKPQFYNGPRGLPQQLQEVFKSLAHENASSYMDVANRLSPANSIRFHLLVLYFEIKLICLNIQALKNSCLDVETIWLDDWVKDPTIQAKNLLFFLRDKVPKNSEEIMDKAHGLRAEHGLDHLINMST